MRKRIVKLLIIIALIQISNNASAQFSVGANLGVVKPEGKLFFWGGELVGYFNLSNNFRVGLGGGYHKNIPTWKVDKETGIAQKVWASAIPITLSGEYFFLQEKVRPFVGLSVGLLSLGNRYANYRTHEYYTYVSPILGLEYQLNRKWSANFKARYGFGLSKHTDPTKLNVLTTGIGLVYTMK